MNRIVIVLALLSLTATTVSAQETPECFPILTDKDSVEISLLYSEGKVCIFGKAPEGADEIAAILISTTRPDVEVGIKKKILLFWITGKKFLLKNMPAIYQAASGSIFPDSIDNTEMKYGYSALHSKWSFRQLSGVEDSGDENTLFNGFVQLKEKQGLYRYEPNAIVLKKNGLFHYKFPITDAPEGEYLIRVRAYKGDSLCGISEQTITISRAGIVADMTWMAKNQPILYGIIAVLTAGVTGIVASVAFKGGGE